MTTCAIYIIVSVMDFLLEEVVISISKIDFFEEWRKHKKEDRNSKLTEFVLNKINCSDVTLDSKKNICTKISSISSKFAEKWSASKNTLNRFLNNNKDWLEGNEIQFEVQVHRPSASSSSGPSRTTGRPRKEFDESSFKTKKRKVEDLVQSRSASELTIAAEVANRVSGRRNVASSIHKISDNSPKAKTTNVACGGRQLSSDEALAHYVDAKCTSHSYKQTRKVSLNAGHQIFPSYHSVVKSKKMCYPLDEYISVTETRAEINLQGILNKTADRLIEAQSDVIRNVVSSNSSLTLINKWGCDGSSGHSTYKQRFEDANATDEFLFMFSLVPLKLCDGQHIIWQNPRPSSTLYCRPIKFIFSKETNEFTKAETNKVLEEISQLLPTICNVEEYEITIKHDLLLTMTDGKVCNALTDTRSPQKCYICGATPTMMNGDLKDVVVNKEHYGFGLSTLHAWIRCFECLLHISYRLDIKKWQARGADDKISVKLRSEKIKLDFKTQMGLIVDKPKPGYGNTNDGNTARRFFMNPELSGEITGLDVNLIKKMCILLRTLSSGYDINYIEFEKVCSETRSLYLSLYPWYNMPVTVHKILLHSTEVIQSCIVPIGQLSEEAQEARNKDCRRFREHHSRKQSRIATNTDLLHMLLITSDPVINSLREIPKKRPEKLPAEVLSLIVPPSIPTTHQVPREVTLCEENDYVVPDSSNCDSDDESSDDFYL